MEIEINESIGFLISKMLRVSVMNSDGIIVEFMCGCDIEPTIGER